MKTAFKILLIITLLFVFEEKIYAQATSTQGTDFWLTFGQNWDYSYSQVNLQVRIVTSDAATVTFTYTESGTTNTVSIAAGSVYTHQFTYQEKSRVYSSYGGTSYKSLHIESDVPVSVYALNQYNVTADATNVLPVAGLGTDYYHISYRACRTYNEGYTVIATEDGTEIYEDGMLQDILQKGQVYSAYFGNMDVTGKHITSSHPIAYFVTNGGVWIPINTGNGADCLYQQLAPVNKWGNNFLVPVTHRGVERIRIVASQDSTVITQSGGTIVNDNGGYSQNSLNLDRGQFVELVTTLGSCGCYISSNKPVGVCTYLMGTYYNSYPYLLVYAGDPAIAWVPPIEQSINGALIAPFIPGGNSALNEHFALIVTPTATKDQTTMATGADPATGLTGGQWCDNTASNFSFYSLQLSNNPNDSYYFANPYGLTVMGYGIGAAESYYYLAGAASRDLDAAFYVNNIHYQDLDGGVICDTIVTFRASIQYAMSTTPGYLKWYVDSVEQVAVRDTLEWSGTLPVGAHNVYIEVLDMNGDAITLSAAFNIGLAYYDTINATICLGDRYVDGNNNFDTIPTQAGYMSYSLNYTTTTGCDSIFTLNLTVNPSYHDTINASICFGDTYINPTYAFLDTTPTAPGLIAWDTTLYTVIGGCDSTVRLELTVLPVYDTLITDTICFGDTYTNPTYAFLDTTPTVTGLLTMDTTLYTIIGGCDSTVRLNLTVLPVYDTLITYTICFGDTYINPTYAFLDTTPTATGLIALDTTLYTIIGDCDSTVRLELTVLPVYNDTITASICLDETYSDYGFNEKPA
ncbi:MAG: IgGFc-binding protein, partial [Prevotellaceae bacterium]|nr:IgGFc-binding protein [Prevotellaceae bacterium]